MLLGIYSWLLLLCCAAAVYEVVLAGQEQAGKDSGAEHGMHSTVHTTVLVFLGTQQGVHNEQPPDSRLGDVAEDKLCSGVK